MICWMLRQEWRGESKLRRERTLVLHWLASESREDTLFVVAQDLVCRTVPLFRAAFHEALEVDRAVFAGEMNLALTCFFVTAEERVLSDAPARIAAEQVRITGRIAQGCRTCVVGSGSWPDLLKLLDKGPGVLLNQRISAGRIR